MVAAGVRETALPEISTSRELSAEAPIDADDVIGECGCGGSTKPLLELIFQVWSASSADLSDQRIGTQSELEHRADWNTEQIGTQSSLSCLRIRPSELI